MDKQLPVGWGPEVVGAVRGQGRTWLHSARERGRPGTAAAHGIRHLSGDGPRLGVRIRPSEDPLTSSHLGASALGWQREDATKNWVCIHGRGDWRSY